MVNSASDLGNLDRQVSVSVNRSKSTVNRFSNSGHTYDEVCSMIRDQLLRRVI